MNKWLKHTALALAAISILVFGMAGNLCCSSCVAGTSVAGVGSCCSSVEKMTCQSGCCGAGACVVIQEDVSYVDTRTTVSVPQLIAVSVPVTVFAPFLPEAPQRVGSDFLSLFYVTPRDYLSKLRVLVI